MPYINFNGKKEPNEKSYVSLLLTCTLVMSSAFADGERKNQGEC